MEDSTLLALAGIIAGVGVGLGTALMSFWWNYKTRAMPHQEFLYQKQIEAYLELSVAISRSIRPCYDFLYDFGREITPEKQKEFQMLTLRTLADLREQIWKSLTILPLDVVLSTVHLLADLVGEVPKLANAEQMVKMLVDAEMRVCNDIRKRAGVEPLTEEMLRAFGTHT